MKLRDLHEPVTGTPDLELFSSEPISWTNPLVFPK